MKEIYSHIEQGTQKNVFLSTLFVDEICSSQNIVIECLLTILNVFEQAETGFFHSLN